MNIEILQGDCIESLKKIEDGSINTCITSPPYWGLRDYNGESKQLGMEDTPEEFTENLVKVFREIKRVLRDDGTAWLNLGDSYSSGGRTTTTNQSLRGDKDYGVTRPKPSKGIKPKDLVGIPWRVAFALQADGWYLRQDIIWHKPNPMPESVRDRCTKAHEYIFLLSKNVKYYYDHEAIKEDAKYPQGPNSPQSIKKGQGEFGMDTRGGLSKIGSLAKRNKRSVWTITTKPFKGAHFATFPKDLIEPCVLAGCPEKVCVQCSEPYKLKVDIKRIPRWELSPNDPRYRPSKYENAHDSLNGNTRHSVTETKPLGLEKQCDCQTNETKGGTVLDPFGGSGTTGIVAASHNRNAILLELNAEYIELAKARINKEVGMMATIKHIKEVNQ
jgi:DNA modification methylase